MEPSGTSRFVSRNLTIEWEAIAVNHTPKSLPPFHSHHTHFLFTVANHGGSKQSVLLFNTYQKYFFANYVLGMVEEEEILIICCSAYKYGDTTLCHKVWIMYICILTIKCIVLGCQKEGLWGFWDMYGLDTEEKLGLNSISFEAMSWSDYQTHLAGDSLLKDGL